MKSQYKSGKIKETEKNRDEIRTWASC